MRTYLERNDFRRAIESQDACNLFAIVNAFAEVIRPIKEDCQATGQPIETHPICRLYAEQIAHLTSGTGYFAASQACEERANQ